MLFFSFFFFKNQLKFSNFIYDFWLNMYYYVNLRVLKKIWEEIERNMKITARNRKWWKKWVEE